MFFANLQAMKRKRGKSLLSNTYMTKEFGVKKGKRISKSTLEEEFSDETLKKYIDLIDQQNFDEFFKLDLETRNIVRGIYFAKNNIDNCKKWQIILEDNAFNRSMGFYFTATSFKKIVEGASNTKQIIFDPRMSINEIKTFLTIISFNEKIKVDKIMIERWQVDEYDVEIIKKVLPRCYLSKIKFVIMQEVCSVGAYVLVDSRDGYSVEY